MTDEQQSTPIRDRLEHAADRAGTFAEDVAMAEYLAAEEALEASADVGSALQRLTDLQRQQVRWWVDDLRAVGRDLRDVKDAGDLLVLPLRHLERRSGHLLQGTLDSLDVWRDLARSVAEPSRSVWKPFGRMVQDDL